MTTTPPTAAVILAGGRGTRMGGVDKPGLLVHGRRLLDIALSATSHLDAVVVVGPHRPELAAHITQTQESPAGAGPVEAIWAGLSATRLPENAVVVVLASDLPYVEAGSVDALIAATSTDNPVNCAVDENNRIQFLFSAWTFRELQQRLSMLRESSGLENQPMKAIVTEPFSTLSVAGTTDCDTPEDIDHARSHPRLTIDQARAAVRNSLTALPPHRADLAESLGATLAQPLVALGDLPRSDVAAMDGYAVSGDGPWRVRTEIRIAGADGQLELGEGEAIRIATGAHLPAGATSVIRDEYLSVDAPSRTLRRLPDAPHRNDARPRGEDWGTGFTIAPTGTAVTPAVISAAASGEVFDALVRGPVRARVVVTGDEIRRTGPLREGQTRDSVGGILPYLLERNGARCVSNSHLRDTADSFERVLADATEQDLLVVIGATGGGAADEMRSALDRLGARTIVGRVASRPGGSQITAVLPSGRVVLGLPGNPYAAVTTLLTMLPTVVAALTGSETPPPLLGIIENATAVSSDAVRLLPVTQSTDGRWRADPSVRTAHLAGLIGRSAFALVPAHAQDGALAEVVVLPR
ncbi:NTP transferase domain-containing protein [Rhodococcus erythropolis]|uniref:NTP transferase domain-containing protein n=1 Tax=Rhodococcus erythropolis TaxID=1833 RepID=UPI001BEAA469|nr:NTP transferase domain-containing protein [Rhodococcus erythropolis]MBT2266916.1 NTP transferase domain-containing protein [Rhodococcus erythropolis]